MDVVKNRSKTICSRNMSRTKQVSAVKSLSLLLARVSYQDILDTLTAAINKELVSMSTEGIYMANESNSIENFKTLNLGTQRLNKENNKACKMVKSIGRYACYYHRNNFYLTKKSNINNYPRVYPLRQKTILPKVSTPPRICSTIQTKTEEVMQEKKLSNLNLP